MEKNIPLTRFQMLSLDDDTEVWLEYFKDNCLLDIKGEPAMLEYSKFFGERVFQCDDGAWRLITQPSDYGRIYRAWLHEPSAADLADNPWPDQSGQ